MNEAQVRVEPVRQEAHVPEYNLTTHLNGLMYRLGRVTAESGLKGRKGEPKRSIGLRTDRTGLVWKALADSDKRGSLRHLTPWFTQKELFRTAFKARTDEGLRGRLKAIFAEAHDRDEIARRYLRQGDLHVSMGELGEQSSRYTRIVPPDSRLPRDEAGEVIAMPPIFLIPGFENDVDCMGALAQEVALKGREIIVVGQPDSHFGNTTPEFSAQIAKDKGYESYAAYYKAVIKALVPEGDVELWGHSMGTAIAAEILNDPEMQERVPNAAFLCPVGTIDQPVWHIQAGLAREARRLATQFSTLGKYTFAWGRMEGQTPETEEQLKLKKGNMPHLFSKIARRSEAFVTARVREGGTITVLNGEKDFVTHSFEGTGFVERNPQVRVVNLPNGHHNTPFTDAGYVAPMLLGR